ncbi:MAG: hypothetical protein ACKPKO_57550 [Candidatus Fonsibacter sp.]
MATTGGAAFWVSGQLPSRHVKGRLVAAVASIYLILLYGAELYIWLQWQLLVHFLIIRVRNTKKGRIELFISNTLLVASSCLYPTLCSSSLPSSAQSLA